MNNEQGIPSDICTISENNLEAVLFSEFSGAENMIITSDGISNLSELVDGALCYDETTNELVFVNMVQPNLNGNDSHSVFSALEGASVLTDLPTFNGGNPVMLLANGSIVIPNDDDNNIVTANTDPFILQFVQNQVEPVKQNSKPETIVQRAEESVPHTRNYAVVKQNEKDIVVDDLLDDLEGLYHCESCSKSFTKHKEYRMHLQSHKDRIHKCSHCGNSFNKLKNLILHEALHNPVDTICPLDNCQKKFRRLASLKAHIKLHEEEEAFTCTECGEEFRNQMGLEQHRKCQPNCRLPVHFVDIKDTKNDDSGGGRSCKLCNRKFSNLSTLAAHKKEHEKIKKALATKSHRKKSTSSKPSSRINRCKICPKWFLKPSQLIRHMRIHTGERPYECTECHKAFNQANSLKIHMLKHTGDRPYQCPFCHSGFSQRGNLRQHINRVHSIPKVEDLVYECSECPCIFRKICSLNAHRNRVHRKGYKLILPNSSEENENESYISGRQDSSIVQPSNGEAEQLKDSGKLLKVTKQNTNSMYLCPECTSTFKTVSTLKAHLNEVHVQLPPPRNEHENSITLENNLDDLDEEEMEKLLKKQTTVNTIMIAVDRGNGDLWNQKVFIKKKAGKQSYQCSHCPKESVKLNEIIRHVKVNVFGKIFKCEYCSKTFSQHSTFKTHLSLHATAKTYHCQVCENKFPNPAELKAHTKSHTHVGEDVICMSCMKTYSSKEPDKHQCVETQTLLDLVKMDNVSRPIECNDVQHLHDKANLILPPYVCSRCNVTFKTYSKLKLHIEDHDKLACKSCNARFTNEEKLQDHVTTVHQVSKDGSDKQCPKCGQSYKDSKSLARHVKKVHVGEKEVKKNERVANADKEKDVLPTSVIVNAVDAEVQNGVEFMMAENHAVDMNVESSMDYSVAVSGELALKGDLLTNGAISNVSSASMENVSSSQKNRCEDISLLDTTNGLTLSMKNNLSYIMQTETIDDCFLNSQITALPVEGNVEPTSTVFSLPGDIIYKCTRCSQQYSAELDLQKHFQESETCNSGLQDMSFSYFYACHTCYLTFKSLTSFLRHLQTHYGSGMYSCVYCDTPNKTEAELTQHIAAHALKNEYPCVHCGELAETAEAVKKHITDVHLMSSANGKAVETKRKKLVSSELLLSEKEKLMLVDQKPNQYSSISEKVLSSLLKKNIEKGSGSKESPLEKAETLSKAKKKRGNSSTKENRCSYCDRSFKKMCDLIRHIRIHTGEKPFKCDYCNKCFTVKSILNCHLKTHFTVKNIFCHICNRFFSTVGSLKIHMRLHTGDRPYKCLYCKESFRTSGHRDSHQKRHLGEKDKARMAAIEAAMVEIGNQENLELSLSEAINLQDGNFLISEITDIEAFKFQEDMDLVSLEPISSSNDCLVCGKTFKKKADVEKHIVIHNSERPAFTCNICDAQFVQQATLKAHVKVHAATPVQCDVCQKTYASVKNMKVHKVRHHPESLELPFQDENETENSSVSEIADKSGCNARVHLDTNDRDRNKWTGQEDLNLSVLVGKSKKSDALSDFFIMEKQFDLSSMISDFFPDDEK